MPNPSKSTRREFLKKTTLSTMAVPLMGSVPLFDTVKADEEFPIHIFSKHLQFLDYRTAGEKAKEMGFAGLDLTVRPNGHVLPERVETDLPKAIEEIKSAGSNCISMTTAVESTENPIDVNVLRTAAKNGIQYYRCNWYRYPENGSMEDSLAAFGQALKNLSHLNKEIGLVGGYQNHSGTLVGASIWEIKQMLVDVDEQHFGTQFDIRHAMVEGGLSWENSLRLIHSHIKTIALKDFVWKKENDEWKVVNVPIGEGMVDFKKYFGLLKKYRVNVPVILHVEYPLGGAERGNREITVSPDEVYKAMIKDRVKLQELWREA